VRESCRRFLNDAALTDSARLLFLRTQADAMLSAMADSAVEDVATVGRILQHIAVSRDRAGQREGVFLRLHYVAGLRVDEIPSADLRTAAPDLIRSLAPLIAQIRGEMDAQYLKPRGAITTLLEKVRDGREPLLRAIAEDERRLRAIAQSMLRNEKPGVSVSVGDLVHDAALVLDRRRNAPLNRLMLEQLIRQIMRNILSDRGRRRIPGAGKHKSELTDPAVDAASRRRAAEIDDGPFATLLLDEMLLIADEVVEEIRRKRKPRDAEIVRARWFESMKLGDLVRLHGASLSTVRRLLADARAMFEERLNGHGAHA